MAKYFSMVDTIEYCVGIYICVTYEVIDSSSSDKKIRKHLKYRAENELNDDGGSGKLTDTHSSSINDQPTWAHMSTWNRLFLGLMFRKL